MMMVTVTMINALVAIINDNYGGCGYDATAPSQIVSLLDFIESKPFTNQEEWIVVWVPVPTERRPITKAFAKVETILKVRVITWESGERLKDIVDEVRCTINNNAIAGVTDQYVSGENNLSDRREPVYIYDLTVTAASSMVPSAVAYGSTISTDWIIEGDLQVKGNDIYDSSGSVVLSFSGAGQVDILNMGIPVTVIKDEDDMASDLDTALCTQQSIKAYVDAAIAGGEFFKTITGITNDVVADGPDDTLTLASANNRLTIVGTTATDTITFTLVEANISHDAIADVSVDDHHAVYTDAMAIAAVVAEDPLTLTHGLTIAGALAGVTTLSMSGELDLTGALACIDLNPAGTGSKNIIDITPAANLVAGSSWRGIRQLLSSLDPATGAACDVRAIDIDMSGFASVDGNAQTIGMIVFPPPADSSYAWYHYMKELTATKVQTGLFSFGSGVYSVTGTYRGVHLDWDAITRDAGVPVLEGIRVDLPADYTGFGANFAAYFSGGGENVQFCQGSWSILTGPSTQQHGIAMYGELQIAGAYGHIDLNPAGTGSKNIIDITPSAALVAGSAWYGLRMDIQALDPAAGAVCYIYGAMVDGRTLVSGDNNAGVTAFAFFPPYTETSTGFYHALQELTRNEYQTAFASYGVAALSATATYRGLAIAWSSITRDANAPVLEGIRVDLPADYTGFGANFAAYFSGDGRWVKICDTTYALDVSGVSRIVGDLTVANIVTAGLVDGVDVSTLPALIAATVSDDVYAAGWNGVTDVAPSKNAVYDKIQTIGGGGEDLSATLAIGNESDGEDIIIDSAGDLIVYSDDKVTEKARIDGATGAITTASTVDGVDVAGHVASLDSHTDLTATAAQLEALLQFGSANAAWNPCMLYDKNGESGVKWNTGGFSLLRNLGSDFIFTAQLSLPPVKGTLKLYVAGTKVVLSDADATNYIDRIKVFGYNENPTQHVIDDSGAIAYNSAAEWIDPWTGVDCSMYDNIVVYVYTENNAAQNLDIAGVALKCYYE